MKVKLYVQGVKTVAGIDDRSQWGYAQGTGITADYGSPQAVTPDYKVYREVEYKSVLPEDQKRFVKMVKALGEHHGFEVEVIDAAKEGLIKKLMHEQIRKINTFPTLVTNKGDKLEGYAKKEEIRKLLRLKNEKKQ